MSTFLIDYENVGESGLKGVEYLQVDDRLVLFYSDVCKTMRRDDLDRIEKSKCEFEMVRLVHTGKNALDFYIAARAGELLSTDKFFIIVSKDKGLDAIKDYLRSRNAMAYRVETVENGILNCKGNRAQTVMNNRKSVNLVEYETIRNTMKKIEKRIRNCLVGTCYESKANNVVDFVFEKRNVDKFSLYNQTTHRFGRNEGREIYNIIKAVI